MRTSLSGRKQNAENGANNQGPNVPPSTARSEEFAD